MGYLNKTLCILAIPFMLGFGKLNAQSMQEPGKLDIRYRDNSGPRVEVQFTKVVAGDNFVSPGLPLFGIDANGGYDGRNLYLDLHARFDEFLQNDFAMVSSGIKPLKTGNASLGIGLAEILDLRYENPEPPIKNEMDRRNFYSNPMNVKSGMSHCAQVRGRYNSKRFEGRAEVDFPLDDFRNPLISASGELKTERLKIGAFAKGWNLRDYYAELSLTGKILDLGRYLDGCNLNYCGTFSTRGGLPGYPGEHAEYFEAGLSICPTW